MKRTYTFVVPKDLAAQLRAVKFTRSTVEAVRFCHTGRAIIKDFFTWVKKHGRKSPYTALDAVQWAVENKDDSVRCYIAAPQSAIYQLRSFGIVTDIPDVLEGALSTLWNDLAASYTPPNHSAAIKKLNLKAKKLETRIAALDNELRAVEDEITNLTNDKYHGLDISKVSFRVGAAKKPKTKKTAAKASCKAA